ncbi:MAG: 2TM domain-containing protein [Cyanobacteria bacterium P01_F01_bin.150]
MPSSAPSPQIKTYRQDEVQEILHLAIANQAKAGELSRDQLFEIADELGLSPQDIQAAEQEWQGLQRIDQEKQAFIRWRRLQFQHHSVRYLIVNGFFLALGVVTNAMLGYESLLAISPAISFALFIAMIWGLFLVLDGWQSRQAEGRTFERKFRKWQRRQWINKSISNFFGRLFGAA